MERINRGPQISLLAELSIHLRMYSSYILLRAACSMISLLILIFQKFSKVIYQQELFSPNIEGSYVTKGHVQSLLIIIAIIYPDS